MDEKVSTSDKREDALGEEKLSRLVELFKYFGDQTRMRILYTLFSSELSVSELSGALGMTVSAVSHQLRLLKQGRLVSSRRSGQKVYYALADEHVYTLIEKGMEHVEELYTF